MKRLGLLLKIILVIVLTRTVGGKAKKGYSGGWKSQVMRKLIAGELKDCRMVMLYDVETTDFDEIAK